ncbi:DNA-binding transcriptional LysR family regulator [Prauserella shujinwangii]|uniref:DNA-binding transcriptional LysR family regulator n=1 Tax=Prauserella shujinwangii TaxID=1453103 RepID=A0A2T0LV54_9PSEU|nr:LysR family transcriptional regulator [Prauserella shujinwangii]PRX47722.1 DNA-binding transcriptional LysR family regulator [Prauserella shujinwangii]
MIDLRRLQVLRVLAERETITATAEVLHLTPSAVSQQLKTLSRDLGVELLRRDGRRVRLTPAALALLEHTENLYEQWERARAELAEHGGSPAGRLGICGVSSAIAALIAPAVTRLRRTYPRLDAHIREEESGDCYGLLQSEDCDIAVVLPTSEAPPEGDPRFDRAPLLDDPQDLLVPEGHPLAGAAEVRLADAAGEWWIVKPPHNDTYPLLLTACAAAGFTPRISHHVKEWFAVSALVAEGAGVCLLPRLVPLPERHAVVRVPLHGQPRPSRRFVTCVRTGSATAPAIAAGLAALRDAAATAVRAA